MITMPKELLRLCLFGMCVTVLGVGQSGAGTIEVRLGDTIERGWADVERDGYAYGPKQAYHADTRETQIWLPYGKEGVYHETAGLKISDPGPEGAGVALATTMDGNTSGRLVYALRFDKPIGAFRVSAGWSEWGVGGATVGGVEYSVDGRSWNSIREISAKGIVEPLLSPATAKVEDLHTRSLYLRFYTRDKANPDSDFGPNRWMKLRLTGDPAWGDRAQTFFRSQVQLWVKPSDRPDDVEDSATVKPVSEPRSAEALLNNTGPWGLASGAEWSRDFSTFNPLLKDAGVRWLRYFPEWKQIQPRPDEWNWTIADRLVDNARENGMQITGLFAYFAPWASADGSARRGPIRDIQYWRDYVRETMARYRNDIRHWEVWNEFNGSFYQGPNKPKEYADLTVAAYEEARKVDPAIMIGMCVANFDVGFLDAAIKAGAADHFDFIAVHPYENLGTVMSGGGEMGYLSMAGNLRAMLAANNQDADMPLWITETGVKAKIEPDEISDAKQAEAMVKVYVLSVAQGFDKIFWFEARGPAYGKTKTEDHGIIRADWSLRPSYFAMQTMTQLLGDDPGYLGWLELDEKGFGFVFRGADADVLVAWMPPGSTGTMRFDAPVRVFDLNGQATPLEAGDALALTRMPVFVTDLPESTVEQAVSQAGQRFPWGKDYATATEVSCRLGATNMDDGIQQTNPKATEVVHDLTETWLRPKFSGKGGGRYVNFRVDPTFAGFGANHLEITVVARRTSADAATGMNLRYESLTGYKNAGKWFGIPAGDGWHEYTWTVSDANFVGGWGYNFALDAVSSPREFDIREVRVKRPDRVRP